MELNPTIPLFRCADNFFFLLKRKKEHKKVIIDNKTTTLNFRAQTLFGSFWRRVSAVKKEQRTKNRNKMEKKQKIQQVSRESAAPQKVLSNRQLLRSILELLDDPRDAIHAVELIRDVLLPTLEKKERVFNPLELQVQVRHGFERQLVQSMTLEFRGDNLPRFLQTPENTARFHDNQLTRSVSNQLVKWSSWFRRLQVVDCLLTSDLTEIWSLYRNLQEVEIQDQRNLFSGHLKFWQNLPWTDTIRQVVLRFTPPIFWDVTSENARLVPFHPESKVEFRVLRKLVLDAFITAQPLAVDGLLARIVRNPKTAVVALEHLELKGSWAWSSETLPTLATHCPKLSNVVLNYYGERPYVQRACPHVTAQQISALHQACPRLQQMNLHWFDDPDADGHTFSLEWIPGTELTLFGMHPRHWDLLNLDAHKIIIQDSSNEEERNIDSIAMPMVQLVTKVLERLRTNSSVRRLELWAKDVFDPTILRSVLTFPELKRFHYFGFSDVSVPESAERYPHGWSWDLQEGRLRVRCVSGNRLGSTWTRLDALLAVLVELRYPSLETIEFKIHDIDVKDQSRFVLNAKPIAKMASLHITELDIATTGQSLGTFTLVLENDPAWTDLLCTSLNVLVISQWIQFSPGASVRFCRALASRACTLKELYLYPSETLDVPALLRAAHDLRELAISRSYVTEHVPVDVGLVQTVCQKNPDLNRLRLTVAETKLDTSCLREFHLLSKLQTLELRLHASWVVYEDLEALDKACPLLETCTVWLTAERTNLVPPSTVVGLDSWTPRWPMRKNWTLMLANPEQDRDITADAKELLQRVYFRDARRFEVAVKQEPQLGQSAATSFGPSSFVQRLKQTMQSALKSQEVAKEWLDQAFADASLDLAHHQDPSDDVDVKRVVEALRHNRLSEVHIPHVHLGRDPQTGKTILALDQSVLERAGDVRERLALLFDSFLPAP